MRFFPVFCLFALFFILQPAALAEEADEIAAIGAIAETEGTVALSRAGEVAVAEPGQPVFLNDAFETGPGARALILFIDETELTLGENALAEINDYVFDADEPEYNRGRFSVTRGAFIFVTGLLKQNEKPDVAIETAYGSIGIRGTTVWGGALDDVYNIFVADGAVSFATNRGRVTLGAGEGTNVRGRDSIPERARKWDEDKIGRAVRTVALQNRDRARERVARMKEQHAAMRAQHREVIRKRRDQNREPKQDRRQQHRDNLQQLKQQREEQRQQLPENRGRAEPASEMERRERQHLNRGPARRRD